MGSIKQGVAYGMIFSAGESMNQTVPDDSILSEINFCQPFPSAMIQDTSMEYLDRKILLDCMASATMVG